MFHCCGSTTFCFESMIGSGRVKRPKLEPKKRAPKLSRPDSESRSLAVKCMGLMSEQDPLVDWPSPKGRLVIVSQGLPLTLERARSVPSQSGWIKYVVLLA